MEQNHTRRVGAAAIACALVIRLFTSGLPEALVKFLREPNTAAFLLSLETGRKVRFSPYQEAFSPQFAESPPPELPKEEETAIPAFADAELPRIFNTSRYEPDIRSLLESPLQWSLQGDYPTVLILHTHSTESYTRQGEDYTETARWRTADGNFNMVSIGQAVAEDLRAGGITVIHDRELHDYPSYNGSYTRTRKAMEEALSENPGIKLVLDLHRDASEGADGQMRTMAQVDGSPSAQLMLVVGTNHEQYPENLSLALKLHAQLERQAPGIMRSLQLRPARFNQDLSPGALLIEVGAAGNTHQEALTAAHQLAQAILALARGCNPEGETLKQVPPA